MRKSDIALYTSRAHKNNEISGQRAPRILEIRPLTDPYEPIGHADQEIFPTPRRIWP